MKRLGITLHIVQKKLIVRDPATREGNVRPPKINSVVVNHKRMKIGRVFDVFGPIENPYIVVKPYRKIDAATHLSEKLYVEESRFSGRDRKN